MSAKRIPVRVPEDTYKALDDLADTLSVPSRLEAVRWLIRHRLPEGPWRNALRCVAAIERTAGPITTERVLVLNNVDAATLAELRAAGTDGEPLSATIRRLILNSEAP